MRKMVLGAAIAMVSVSAIAAESYQIDPFHTYPNFTINHLGFSTMHGRFDKTEGKLTIDWEKNTGTVDIVIDAESISTGMQKRDDHLRSPDFLNTAEFPDITYKSTNVTINGDKSAKVDGDLTIMGVTKPVTLNVKRINCGDHPMKQGTYICGFDATGNIKRSDFGMTYALPAVGDEMELFIEVEAERQ